MFDGYSSGTIKVNVPQNATLIPFNETITQNNSVTTIIPPQGVDGFSEGTVLVNIQGRYSEIDETYTANGEYSIVKSSDIDGFSGGTITVNVPQNSPNLQVRDVTISRNGQESITATTGYDGLSQVNITTNVPQPELQNKTVTLTNQMLTPEVISGQTPLIIFPDNNYDALSRVNIYPHLEWDPQYRYTNNGTYYIQPTSDYLGLTGCTVSVDVPTESTVNNTTFTENITSNGTVTVYSPSGNYTGYSGGTITVNVPQTAVNNTTFTQTLSSNGTWTLPAASSPYTGYSGGTVTVNVPSSQPNLQNKIVGPYNTNGIYDVYPDSGYDGLSRVTVDVDVNEQTLLIINGFEFYNNNTGGQYDNTNATYVNLTWNTQGNISYNIPIRTSTQFLTVYFLYQLRNDNIIISNVVVATSGSQQTVSVNGLSGGFDNTLGVKLVYWHVNRSDMIDTSQAFRNGSIVFMDKTNSIDPKIIFEIQSVNVVSGQGSVTNTNIFYDNVYKYDYSSVFPA